MPRIKQTLAEILDERRMGRPKKLASWQKEFKADWVFHSKCDEQRRIERELKWRKMPLNTKNRAERIAQLEAEAERENGTYVTDIHLWTCSCPAYLISRFLLCKHLVRLANMHLGSSPVMDLQFFLNIRREHFPPYYRVPGIHPQSSTPVYQLKEASAPSKEDLLVSTSCNNRARNVSDGTITPAFEQDATASEWAPEPQAYARSSSPSFGDLVADDWLEGDEEEAPADQYVRVQFKYYSSKHHLYRNRSYTPKLKG
jgi:hypothetical protein